MGTSDFYKLSLYFTSWVQMKFLLLNPFLYQGKKGREKRQVKTDIDSMGSRVFLYFSR